MECADLAQRLYGISQVATCLFVILISWGMFTAASWASKITMRDDDPPDEGRPAPKNRKGK